jgi:hypothetical protein
VKTLPGLKVGMRSRIINTTLVLLAVFVVSCVWMGLSFPPAFIYSIGGMAGLSLFVLFFLNLGFAVFQPKQRISYLTMSLLVAILLGGLLFFWPRLVGSPEEQWFLRSGMQTYSQMVDRIIENKAMLTSQWRPLTDIVARSDVHGKTNADGSVAVSLPLRSNYSRGHGYLYYSGTEMVAQSGDGNRYFLNDTLMYYRHITNNWFEF